MALYAVLLTPHCLQMSPHNRPSKWLKFRILSVAGDSNGTGLCGHVLHIRCFTSVLAQHFFESGLSLALSIYW